MPVELRSVDDLDIDDAVLDFTDEIYCGNCTHVELQDGKITGKKPYCRLWGEPTRVEPGLICPMYRPTGFR